MFACTADLETSQPLCTKLVAWETRMCSMSFSAGPHLKMTHGAAAVLDKTVPVSGVVVGLTARAIVCGRCACAETTLVAPAASTNASAKLPASDAILISFASLICLLRFVPSIDFKTALLVRRNQRQSRKATVAGSAKFAVITISAPQAARPRLPAV